ncbi:MAG: chromate efflux transporter [Bacteroidota bacterium]
MKELAWFFLRFGLTAFGGPAAHVAMLEQEVVHKRAWMNRELFLDLMGATNLIPGPNSTELVMLIGYHRGGIRGLLVAGACFIFPAAILSGILAFFYAQYGELPAVEPFLLGIKPAVIAIIIAAVYRLGKKAIRKPYYLLIGILVATLALGGINEVLALLGGGLFGMCLIQLIDKKGKLWSIAPWPFLFVLPLLQVPARLTTYHPGNLFLSFLKIGAVLFGSGYVLFAYLEGELVDHLGWITQQELIDSVAAGQFTPGPVLTTATFIGFLVDGVPGAMLATLGIFLPAFVLSAIVHPYIPRLRGSEWAGAFLDAVNVGALGLMAAVLFSMGLQTMTSGAAFVIAGISATLLIVYPKLNPAYIVLAGALLGYGLMGY